MFRKILFVIYCTYFILADNNFLSDEYISSLNERQSSWVAGRNFDDNPRMLSVVKKLASNILPGEEVYFPDTHYAHFVADDTVIPDSFDARTEWSKCSTIGQVWDQGVCGSGWAISTASVLSDRICIQLNQTQNPVLSPEDLLTCCTQCRFGCDGGWANFAWEYLNNSGITTGGTYQSNEGCKPYSNPGCGHFNGSSQTSCSDSDPACIPPCYRACVGTSEVIYAEDLYFAQEYYRVGPNETEIKLEIMQNGPVQTIFPVWSDFLNYKNGVYVENVTSVYLGDQAGKLIGWGTEDDQPYWLAVNSWNTEWGDKGLFKWLVNNNDSSIESQIYAALPSTRTNDPF